jgi:hypothetical protein
MSNEELGMNTYIKEDKGGKYIMFKGEQLCVGEQPVIPKRGRNFRLAYVRLGAVRVPHRFSCTGNSS